MASALKPDSIKVNLDLAKAYIEKHKKLWACDNPGAGESCLKSDIVVDAEICSESKRLGKKEKFAELAEKVKENSELFSQLEFMRRGVHPQDVIKWDIELLVQNLLYCSTAPTTEVKPIMAKVLKISEEVPLAHLGFETEMMRRGCQFHIQSSVGSAPVCTLFVQLCHQAGFEGYLDIVEDPHADSLIRALPGGCIGVVAERSDFESAIDVFLDSTTKYPWKLTRLLIQESVYERFQNLIEFKCKLKGNPPASEAQARRCKRAYVYGEKTFLLDFVGDQKELYEVAGAGDCAPTKLFAHLIPVEAYRTTKELVSLIKSYGSFCVSLWCSDISEANEIAFSVTNPAVWINDYAVFRGPPECSRVYYCDADVIDFPSDLGLDHLKKVTDAWLKLSAAARLQKLRKCFQTYLAEENTEKAKAFIQSVEKLLTSSASSACNHKVDVANGTLCVAISIPDVVIMHFMGDDLGLKAQVIAALAHGLRVVYDPTLNDIEPALFKLFQILEKGQLPVKFSGACVMCRTLDFYQYKTVWTSFGTVFAN